MTIETVLAILVLGVLSLYGLAVALKLVKASGRTLNFRSMLIVMFTVVNPISGIVHLARIDAVSRGYWDLLQPGGGESRQLLVPVLSAFLGMAGLLLGTGYRIRQPVNFQPSPGSRLSISNPRFLVIASLILLPVSVAATIKISHITSTFELERVTSLTGGTARIGFLAQWTVWAISFLAVWLASTRIGRSQVGVAIMCIGALCAITLALRWTGGRTAILIFVLPLLITLMPLMSRFRWVISASLIAGGWSYTAYLTERRTENYSVAGFNPAASLDWQFGRFSMMGFAQEFVRDHGLLTGETYLAALLTVPNGIMKLVGWAPLPTPSSVTELSGQALLGSSSLTYIVPGLSAELYMNFGLIGIPIGYFILGRLVSAVDRKSAATQDGLQRLCWAYAGTILCFCTVPSQSGAIYGYAVFVGFPVLLALLVTHFSQRLRRLPDASPVVEPSTGVLGRSGSHALPRAQRGTRP